MRINFKHLRNRSVEALRHWKCGPLLCITLAGLILREEFPFSNFPMYSSFTRKASYVYLATASGEPLPTVPTAGMLTGNLKKVFETDLKQARSHAGARGKVTDEERRAAGERVLAGVKAWQATQTGPAAAAPVARLYQVNILLHNQRFERQTRLLAEVP
ncbi:MAG: hypothetical protein ABR526_10505 [Chthoniobacterales bacterium]